MTDAEASAIRRLLHVTPGDIADGRAAALEAMTEADDSGAFIKSLTFALQDAADTDDTAEVGRIVARQVFGKLRKSPLFPIYVDQALELEAEEIWRLRRAGAV